MRRLADSAIGKNLNSDTEISKQMMDLDLCQDWMDLCKSHFFVCCHYRSIRGSYGQNFRRSQMESGPANTRHSLNNPSSSVLGSQGARQDNTMNEVNQHKVRNTVSDHPAYPPTAAPQPFEVLQRCPRTDLESPLNCQNKSAETLTVQPEQDYGPYRTSGSIKNPSTVADVSNAPKTNKSRPRAPDTTTDCRFSSLKGNKNPPLKHIGNLEKTQNCTITEKELAKDSSVSSENRNQQPEVPVVLTSSEQSKSPSSLSHKASPPVSSQPSKSSVKTAAGVETQSQGHMHNQNADRTSREARHSGLSSTDCTVVDEESHSQNHKWKKKDSSGHGKKEKKSSSTARRSSRMERSRDHEQKRPKESERSKRGEGNNCNSSRERSSIRSDNSKEYERRSTKETDNKDDDKRSKKQVDAFDSRQVFSSPRLDSQRNDVYKGKSSSRINEPSTKSKRSHCYDNSKMEDLKCAVKNGSSEKNCFEDKGMVKDRERKRGGHLKEHRVQKHGESKKFLTKDDRKNSSKKHKNAKKDQDCKTVKDKHLESVHAESPSVVAVSINPCQTSEDNSPGRKLSFMETLNLTLSPLKKQKQSSESTEAIGAASEDSSSYNGRLSDAGEEFYIIDELKNSRHSDEEMDKNSEATTAGEKEDFTSSCKQSRQVVELFTAVASEKPSAEQTDMEVQEENATESQEDVDKVPTIVKTSEEKRGKTSDSNVLDKDSLSKLTLTRESPNRVCENDTEDFLGIISNADVSITLPSKTSEVVVSDNTPDSIVDGCQQQDRFATLSEETSHMEIQRNPQANSQDLLPVSKGVCQDDVSCSDKVQSIPNINSSGSSVIMEVSSSTISVDLGDPSKVICDVEQVGTSKQDNKRAGETFKYSKSIKTQHTSENVKISEKSHQSPLWSQNTMAPNNSTTVEEDTMSSSQPGFLEPDSTEKEEQDTKSLNPVVFCHDEDSMMLTLRNIRVIPELISPLTSPVRQVKKVQPQPAEKQPHVKSLNKGKSLFCF